jgi:hypothetical protein
VSSSSFAAAAHIPMAANPLPYLGRCGSCDEEIRLRTNGTLYRHPEPAEAERLTVDVAADGVSTVCHGSGQESAEILEPTFARWLWSHRTRRDVRTNALTMLAEVVCGPSAAAAQAAALTTCSGGERRSSTSTCTATCGSPAGRAGGTTGCATTSSGPARCTPNSSQPVRRRRLRQHDERL